MGRSDAAAAANTVRRVAFTKLSPERCSRCCCGSNVALQWNVRNWYKAGSGRHCLELPTRRGPHEPSGWSVRSGSNANIPTRGASAPAFRSWPSSLPGIAGTRRSPRRSRIIRYRLQRSYSYGELGRGVGGWTSDRRSECGASRTSAFPIADIEPFVDCLEWLPTGRLIPFVAPGGSGSEN